MKIKFWGVRGSVPISGSSLYGGNTSCVSVQLSDDVLLIFDAGSGIRSLGEWIESSFSGKDIFLFLSHYHWDHIQGFPFFSPLFSRNRRVHVFGASYRARKVGELLSIQMVQPYFPLGAGAFSDQVEFRELEKSGFKDCGFRIDLFPLNHTSPVYGFRLSHEGRILSYCTDTENWGEDPAVFSHRKDLELASFFKGSDLLIMDSQYLPEDYKRGWGHGTVDYAIDAGLRSQAGELVLFHYDPSYSDEFINKMLKRAENKAASFGMKVQASVEGQEIII